MFFKIFGNPDNRQRRNNQHRNIREEKPDGQAGAEIEKRTSYINAASVKQNSTPPAKLCTAYYVKILYLVTKQNFNAFF